MKWRSSSKWPVPLVLSKNVRPSSGGQRTRTAEMSLARGRRECIALPSLSVSFTRETFNTSFWGPSGFSDDPEDSLETRPKHSWHFNTCTSPQSILRQVSSIHGLYLPLLRLLHYVFGASSPLGRNARSLLPTGCLSEGVGYQTMGQLCVCQLNQHEESSQGFMPSLFENHLEICFALLWNGTCLFPFRPELTPISLNQAILVNSSGLGQSWYTAQIITCSGYSAKHFGTS